MSTKLHITFIFLLFQIWVINAQITVPFSVIEKDYEIGAKQFFRANDTLQIYDIGKPGGENRWDFSGISFSTETESEVLDPSTTAYASSYPEANRVTLVKTRTPIPTSSGTDLSLKNVYLYSRIDTDNNQVLSLGSVVEAPMSTQLGNIVSSFAHPSKIIRRGLHLEIPLLVMVVQSLLYPLMALHLPLMANLFQKGD